MGKAVMVAGIGCKHGVSGSDVLAAIDAALSKHALTRRDLGALATIPQKQDEHGILAAAAALDLSLLIPDSSALAALETLTHSQASLDATGIGSVSEAAALAACGPVASLLGPRIAVNHVTCAIATTGDRS